MCEQRKTDRFLKHAIPSRETQPKLENRVKVTRFTGTTHACVVCLFKARPIDSSHVVQVADKIRKQGKEAINHEKGKEGHASYVYVCVCVHACGWVLRATHIALLPHPRPQIKLMFIFAAVKFEA